MPHKTYARKEWTEEEEKLLLDLAATYNTAIIGKKLKRTKESVWAKLRYMGIRIGDLQKSIGVSPVVFAKQMGINKSNVWNWIHRWNLPTVEYPSYMKLDKKYAKNILIDDTKLEDWLMKGYVYSDQINPTNGHYQRIVRNVRRVLDFKYITSNDILETCKLTPKILQYWRYLKNFPRPALIIPCTIVLYNRSDVVEWALNNPHYVTSLQAASLRTAGIGKNLKGGE